MSPVPHDPAAVPHDSSNHDQTPAVNRFEGRFVSMIGNHMVIANMEGQKCSHTLAKHAKLTCDGTDCSTEKLKSGGKIRVTTQLDNRNVAIGIESLDKHTEFAS